MPAIRHDDLLLRLVKEVVYIRSALRRVTTNLPLYDIASENTPAQLTTKQNDYAPGNYDVLILSSDKILYLTGLRGGVRGRSIRLFNNGDYSILIPSESALSTAANRFRLQGGINPVTLTSIEPNTNLQFYYLAAEQRWVTINEPTPYDISDDFVAQTSANYMADVAWSPELMLFCGVYTNVCMTSPDGKTWDSRVVPAGGWSVVEWSPELSLFASITSGAAMYSSDGIIWALGTGVAGAWTSAAWSPALGMFAAVSYSGANTIATSVDGINWTAQTAPVGAGANWTNITWSPELGVFVAVSQLGKTMYSSDGIIWALGTIDAGSWNGVCWSPELSMFVSVSALTNYAATSTDGINWTTQTAPARQWVVVAWTGEWGFFVAAGSDMLMISRDGITWTDATSSVPSGGWSDMAWSPELSILVVVSSSGTNKVMIAPS